MDQITSLAYLLTTGGTIAFVTILTQYIKPLLPEVFPIRLFVLLACLLLQVGITFILSGINVEGMILAVANGVIAAASSLGAYEAVLNKKDKND